MKSMKKLFSLMLALLLVVSLATVASAADETYSITIKNDKAGHIYDAYQIFIGTISGQAANDEVPGTNAEMTDIAWGTGVTYTGTGVVIGKDDNDQDIKSTNAVDIAKALADDKLELDALIADLTLTTPKASTSTHVDGDHYVIEGLPAGYYLIKDRDDTLDGKYDAYTDFIVEVLENSTVTPKSSVPQVEKKVNDINDTNGGNEVREDSADHDIGDKVPFQIVATLGNTVDDYKTYKVVFHDTMDRGLTMVNKPDANNPAVSSNTPDVTITFNGTDVTSYFTVTVAPNADQTTSLTISCDNVKAFGAGNNSVIIVDYKAILNEHAATGNTGNWNKVKLEFSNDPNWVAVPNPDGTTPPPPTGETPEDQVVVFTYDVIINKVDHNNQSLLGATFKLLKKLHAQPAEGSGVVYETVENADGTKEYWQNMGELTGASNNTFTWTGIDDGKYKLVEVHSPLGYNGIEPIVFDVVAQHDETAAEPHLTSLTAGTLVSGNFANTGTITTSIENKPGAILPETGGMGTTLIYILGGGLVLAAVVLLIAKKRMASAE